MLKTYLIDKLKKENKINEEFLTMLGTLSFSEVIIIIFEQSLISHRQISYIQNVLSVLPLNVKDALIEYVSSNYKHSRDASRILGMNVRNYEIELEKIRKAKKLTESIKIVK